MEHGNGTSYELTSGVWAVVCILMNLPPTFFRKESRILTMAGIIRGSQLTLFFTSLTFSSFFTFVTYTSTGEPQGEE